MGYIGYGKYTIQFENTIKEHLKSNISFKTNNKIKFKFKSPKVVILEI